MKNMRKESILYRLVPFLWLFLTGTVVTHGQNLRQITTADGLASSAVTCIHQSDDGMLWIGTLDGLNAYYGEQVIRTDMDRLHSLEGHIIENIVETECHDMWIQTSYGLHRLERLSRKTTSFLQFTGVYTLRLAGNNRVMVRDINNRFYLYQSDKKDFTSVEYQSLKGEKLVDMGATVDFCWLAGNKGLYRYDWTETGEGTVKLDRAVCLVDSPVKFCRTSERPEMVYVIDMENRLYQVDIRRGEKTFILNLGKEVDGRGTLTGITECGGSWFISFKVAGVLKYEYNQTKRAWNCADLGIRSGVFGILKDKRQNLVWIATDGQGLYLYWKGVYSIRSYKYSDFNNRLGKPVRALFVDDRNWLWIGTKGEGLLAIDRSNPDSHLFECTQKLYTSSNSSLPDNSVYALSPSAHGGFWIGTEGGIAFYHYESRSVQSVQGGTDVEYVHSIQEVGDSVLWIATVGKGVFKAKINRAGTLLKLSRMRHFDVDGGNFSSNYFFAMHYTSKGDLWLGNRGHGVFKMYPYGMEPTAWPNKQRSMLQNDVFALYEHKNVLWIGTGCGLVGQGEDGKEWFIDQNDGLPNNIVHSLQVDSKDGLWVATNNGLAQLSPDFSEVKNYGSRDGLRVTEFSDGATFRTNETLYFGGVDGWVEVSGNSEYKAEPEAYRPPLYFIHLRSGDKEISLHLLKQNNPNEMENTKVELERDENVFTISFKAMDYLNMGDYRYSYKVEKSEETGWVDNGSLNTVSLAQLQPGHYIFRVKYRNVATGYESDPVALEIHVKPYWWQSTFMTFLYWLGFLLGTGYLSITHYRKTRRRHQYALQAMEQRHKEELYEEKLRFFTNITHEFSTPLTLIYGPCERILSYEGADDFVRRYVSIIQKHTGRLYQLIQEIVDYRRIETKHQQLHLESFNVSEYVHETCEVFIEMAEKNGVTLSEDIESDIFWNTDRRNLPKIVVNLLSNAMKYTPRDGKVKVSLCKLPEGKLQLKVYNTGKGIKEEDRIRIFNRYSILDEVEENASNGLSRNGLGMAICHSSVKLLEGDIVINSEVGVYAEFVVTLPLLPLPEGEEAKVYVKDLVPLSVQNQEMLKRMTNDNSEEEVRTVVEESGGRQTDKPSVLVVDDNKDILYLLREVMSHSYDVKTARSSEEALTALKTVTPNLIITDVMMPGTDGMTLTRQLKQNKHTMHIPIVILSARNTDEAKTEGIQAGADAYIGKPFNVQYLRSVVNRLIESRKNMVEYYNTSACSYEYVEGQLVKQEDREFIQALNEVVEKQKLDSELTTEDIAAALNISSRSLYRRLKLLGLPAPKEYVRERKMEKAVKLLLTSGLSIQEIIFECGFNNRAHFYKDFSKRFGMTPKEFRLQNRTPDASLETK